MRSREFSPPNCEVVIIAHNIRSIMNVGSILRTAEGFGVAQVFATGYTPHPGSGLPHVQAKLAKQLKKTALGAEGIVDFRSAPDVTELMQQLNSDGFCIVGLEQDPRAIALPDYSHKLRSCKIALLIGEEVNGLTPELRDACDDLVEIPMFGQKESFNVSVATGIVLYHLIATQSAP